MIARVGRSVRVPSRVRQAFGAKHLEPRIIFLALSALSLLPNVFPLLFAGNVLRLFLLRHAKSDWGNKSLDDHDRPLSPRGITAAPRIAAYMRAQKYLPDLAKCSSSQRTRETLEKMVPLFEPPPEIHYSRSLYLAEPKTLLSEIRQTPNSCSALFLVGHNPGIRALALALAALREDQEEAHKERLVEKFPTACLAVLEFSVRDWREVKPLSARLVDYMRVKDLPPTLDDVEERGA